MSRRGSGRLLKSGGGDVPIGHGGTSVPVISSTTISDTIGVLQVYMRQVNAVTYLPVLVWTALGIAVLIGAIALLRSNS